MASSRLTELTALATVASVDAFVTLLERRNAPTPGGGWPAAFERWHALGLFAVASVVVAAVFADDASAAGVVDEQHDGDEA